MSARPLTVVRRALLRLAAGVALAALTNAALGGAPPAPGPEVGFAPPSGGRLATEAVAVTERGEPVQLGTLLGGTSLFVPVYYRCPNLCDLTLDGVAELVAAAPAAARPADIVIFSFAADETPADASAMRASVASRHPEVAGDAHWHFLTAAPDAIDTVTRSIGFRFVRDERSGMYSHVAGLAVAAGDGRLLGLLPGVRFDAARLAEIAADRGAAAAARAPPSLLLWCFHYDPQTGRYTLAVLRTVNALSALCAAALAVFLFISLRKRARRHGP